MGNDIAINGGQAQKPTRFAPIWTGRFSSGIWTNRSPLRDAATSRQAEKFYGAAGDALIAGSNTEVTNRLTLARRPGNSVFDSNSYSNVDRFDEFRMFGPSTEQINVMIDQSNALYSLFGGVKSLVWTKSAGAGQTFMQSVGNTLYFGNGVDNKKWLQSLTIWSPFAAWNTPTTPFLTTFLIDPNGNIQQLTGSGLTPISGAVQPVWSTVTPNAGNNFIGGITVDGTAQWTNRGTPDISHPGSPAVENWGIVAPTVAPTVTVGSSRSAWVANTFFSSIGEIIDSNGNLQKVTTAGKSGATHPVWATTVGLTTADNTAVWTMVQTAASLVWAPSTTYTAGTVLSAAGSLFQLAPFTGVLLASLVTVQQWPNVTSGPVGSFIQTGLNTPFVAGPTASGDSLSIDSPIQADSPANPIHWNTFDSSGAATGFTIPFPTTKKDFQLALSTSFQVPVAGTHTFTITHHDGMIWGIGGGAVKVSGTLDDPQGHTVTALHSYPLMGGTNRGQGDGGLYTETFQVNFPTAGVYPVEFDWAYWFHQGRTFVVTVDGNTLIQGPARSGTTEPVWPAFSTSLAPAYANVTESAGNFVWNNIGPITDFTWHANINFTLPNTGIVDPNGNQQQPFETGVTGTVRPTFSTTLNQLTVDNPNLIWINTGVAQASAPGTISALAGGFQYDIALVNTLDNTLSNAGPLSTSTGNFVGATGITFAPGSGLNAAAIDPQADYVAIFRTVDGGSLPFLIPGTGSSIYTIKLSDYLLTGYTDTTPDTGLNNLISAPISGENTPPAAGASNLAYHLGRIFFSVGNTLYWTSGPDTPAGNGTNGVSPLNFDSLPSLLKRIVPTNQGVIVLTVSDIFIIVGQGTANSPIQKAQVLLKGIGILSYNALDVNGALVGFFTTDKQFVILDPAAGVSYVGLPIGDQFRKNNGLPGTSWNPANVYVTWHVDGEDQAWYVSDGQFGWFRLMPTPAPETGLTWSPFATIVGGCQAVQSIEVSPGVHNLLLGPSGTGPILKRDNDYFQDNGTSYNANAVIGSINLAQPGQIAMVSFVTIDSVRVGKPLSISVLMDEALPYFNGPLEPLTNWESDPPNQPESRSIRGQRFYFSELSQQAAVCRHMQCSIEFGIDSVQSESLAWTLYGAFAQEM